MNEDILNLIDEIREKQTMEVVTSILQFLKERKEEDPEETIKIMIYHLNNMLSKSTVEPFKYEDEEKYSDGRPPNCS